MARLRFDKAAFYAVHSGKYGESRPVPPLCPPQPGGGQVRAGQRQQAKLADNDRLYADVPIAARSRQVRRRRAMGRG